jgi:hypothetical protein
MPTSAVYRTPGLPVLVAKRIRRFVMIDPKALKPITDKASKIRNGISCKVYLERFAVGAHRSICLPIIFEDAHYWLLRVRFPLHSEEFELRVPDPEFGEKRITVLEFMMHTAENTMEFVANQTAIPVPRVYFTGTELLEEWDATYMVMDFVDGVPLTWDEISHLDREAEKNICLDLARVSYEMSKVRIPQIGTIRTKEFPDAHPKQPGSYPNSLAPKFTATRRQMIAPITDPKLYYRLLAVKYWEDAVNGMEHPRSMKYWSWPLATEQERELFSAFLHLQLATFIEQQDIPATDPPSFCLQNPALYDTLSKYLWDEKGRLVAVLDWEQCSTVPFLGFNPIPFAEKNKEDVAWSIMNALEEMEGIRSESLMTYTSTPLSFCMRAMERLVVPEMPRWKLAPDVFKWFYHEELKMPPLSNPPQHPEHVDRVMKRALDHMKTWLVRRDVATAPIFP